jgi:RNA polymerase sigma-70 factor (ECF subfamily)
LEDKELISLLKSEEQKNYAFNMLVRQYQEKLYWHIRRIVIDHDDADDVLQNTFIKVFHGIKKFREDSQLYTWLYRIATNESITFLKKKRTKFFIPLGDVEYQLEENLESDAYFTGDEMEKKFQKALLQLPEKQRIVFNMKYFDEMKYEDISKVLDTSVGALKASYHHATKKIQEYLKDNTD